MIDRMELRLFVAVVMLGAGLGTMSGAAGLAVKGEIGTLAFAGACACTLAMVCTSCWLFGSGDRRAYVAGIGVGLACALYGWLASGHGFLWGFPVIHAVIAGWGAVVYPFAPPGDRMAAE